MPPWKPPWKSMIDPGEVSTYFPRSYPGHPRDLALEYLAAAPPGVEIAAGMASPLMAALGGYQLIATPRANTLFVDNLDIQNPKEARTALREIYNLAKKAGVSSVSFQPTKGKFAWQKRSMHDMTKEYTGREDSGVQTVDLSLIERLLGIK